MKYLSILSLVLLMGCGEAFAGTKCEAIEAPNHTSRLIGAICNTQGQTCVLNYDGGISCFPTPKSK